MNRTKKAICETFWQLLEEKPYNKITVQNIVDRCQVNRNTFYYHFEDIPSLAEYSIKESAYRIIQQNYHFESPIDCMIPIAQELAARKRAFIHIYHSVCSEPLIRYLNELCSYVAESYINNTPSNITISQEDKEFFTRYYKCLFAGVVLDWLSTGTPYDLLDFCRKACLSFNFFGNIVPDSQASG